MSTPTVSTGFPRLSNPWLDNPPPKSMSYPDLEVRKLEFEKRGAFKKGQWPYRQDHLASARIPFYEFSGYGPPPNDVGYPGDIYIDFTPGPGQDYIVYVRQLDKTWRPFNPFTDPSQLTFPLLNHPLLTDRSLYAFGKHSFSWYAASTIHEKSGSRARDHHDPSSIVDVEAYNEGKRPKRTLDNNRRLEQEQKRRQQVIDEWRQPNPLDNGDDIHFLAFPDETYNLEGLTISAPSPASLKRLLDDDEDDVDSISSSKRSRQDEDENIYSISYFQDGTPSRASTADLSDMEVSPPSTPRVRKTPERLSSPPDSIASSNATMPLPEFLTGSQKPNQFMAEASSSKPRKKPRSDRSKTNGYTRSDISSSELDTSASFDLNDPILDISPETEQALARARARRPNFTKPPLDLDPKLRQGFQNVNDHSVKVNAAISSLLHDLDSTKRELKKKSEALSREREARKQAEKRISQAPVNGNGVSPPSPRRPDPDPMLIDLQAKVATLQAKLEEAMVNRATAEAELSHAVSTRNEASEEAERQKIRFKKLKAAFETTLDAYDQESTQSR